MWCTRITSSSAAAPTRWETLLLSFPAFYAQARAEERLPRERFAAEYGAYAPEVPVLVPVP
jgi:protein-S-isoprenylcysteine O-methyltransferase Ste14